MRVPGQSRSLLAQTILWIVLPLALVVFGALGAGVFAYQRTIVSLLMDRDRQLASLAANRVSEAVEGYARVLETLAANPDVRSAEAQVRARALQEAADALQIFNAGVVVTDADGRVLTTIPDGAAPVGPHVGGQPYFQTILQERRPAYSDVVADARTGADMLVIGVPIFDETEALMGALLGAVQLHNTALGEPIRRLNVGDDGFAYLVDRRGYVIFHPMPEYIGSDFTNRQSVARVIEGESGGVVWTAPSGARVVQGYAPVEATGWGMVVREPWSAVIAPARTYALMAAIAGLAALVAAAFLLWRGVRLITRPVRRLAAQTGRLAEGETVEPLADSGVLEIDQLERAFEQMAAQIAGYRAGLRRYVGAITNARENEQRRLARELHDETVQSLLAIARRLELYQTSETDAARQAQLDALQAMVTATMRGVRDLSRDLRPLALEDLGLAPALRTLINNLREADPALPPTRLHVAGPASPLSQEQELALYRITQEALANIRRHAQATQVDIELAFEANRVLLTVCDNGRGFRVPHSLAELAQQGHFGLMGIQERAWAAEGLLAIDSAPGHGTQLRVTLPLAAPAGEVP